MHVKGVQNFCFCQLSMQILWRRRCSRVVDLKLPIISARDTTEQNTRVGARLEGHACSSKSYAKSEFRPRFYYRQTTCSLVKDYVKNSAQIYSTTFFFFSEPDRSRVSGNDRKIVQ